MKLYTIQEYMDKNNMSEPTVYNRKKEGAISIAKIDNKNYILEDDKCKVIAIGNTKGGAGKTTTAVNLACFSALSGLKTLLIDFDHQNNCMFFFPDEFMSKAKKNMFDLLFNNVDLKECIIDTDVLNLQMIVSNEDLVIAAPDEKPPLTLLKDKIEKIKDNYNLIFIDTSPSLDVYNKNSFIAADYVLIPTKLHPLYIKGIEQLYAGVEDLINAGEVNILGVFKTMIDKRLKKTEYYSQFIDENYKEFVFKSEVRTDAAVELLSLERKNVFYLEKKTKAQDDYKNLFKELLERM